MINDFINVYCMCWVYWIFRTKLLSSITLSFSCWTKLWNVHRDICVNLIALLDCLHSAIAPGSCYQIGLGKNFNDCPWRIWIYLIIVRSGKESDDKRLWAVMSVSSGNRGKKIPPLIQTIVDKNNLRLSWASSGVVLVVMYIFSNKFSCC